MLGVVVTDWLTFGLAVLALAVSVGGLIVALRAARYTRERDRPRLVFAASLTQVNETTLLQVTVANDGLRPLRVTPGGFRWVGGTVMSGDQGLKPTTLTDGQPLTMHITTQPGGEPDYVWVLDAAGRCYERAIAEINSPLHPGPFSWMAHMVASEPSIPDEGDDQSPKSS